MGKKPNFWLNFCSFRPDLGPIFFPGFYLYQILRIVASYHCIQFHFGPDLGLLGSKSGREFFFFSKFWLQKQPPELSYKKICSYGTSLRSTQRRYCIKSCSQKFRNIHRKTSVLESLLNRISDLQATQSDMSPNVMKAGINF